MKRNNLISKRHLIRLSSLLIMPILVLYLLSSCEKDEVDDPVTQAYVGSEACMTCHQDHYDKFIKSGHPFKFNKVINGEQPVVPYRNEVVPTPAGYDWDDINYMIGGYFWKARFIDTKGYIMTENSDTQFNIADGSQVAYHANDPMGTKIYDCGKCHVTGWVSIAEGGTPHDGLEGMGGQFAQGGIHCEACHGMGAVHADSKLASDITLDNSSADCGRCHTRNQDNSIAASGGFIKHHEQYDEWLASGGHFSSNIGCNTCHDPHASTVNDDLAPGEGVKASCTSCHTDYNMDKHTYGGVTCVTCHMPLASKSAIKTGDYAGDVHSHTFKINPAADGTLFNAEGTLANPEGLGLSLDYACYSCHKDVAGLGGANSAKTMVELSAKATNFHGL